MKFPTAPRCHDKGWRQELKTDTKRIIKTTSEPHPDWPQELKPTRGEQNCKMLRSWEQNAKNGHQNPSRRPSCVRSVQAQDVQAQDVKAQDVHGAHAERLTHDLRHAPSGGEILRTGRERATTDTRIHHDTPRPLHPPAQA